MEYISIHEISKLWNMKERKITSLCRENRIAGARKVGKTWLIPNNALKPLDKRTKEYENTTKKLDAEDINVPLDSGSAVVNAFKRKYKKEPMYTTFTPYRICPLGAHVDHNLGNAVGFAIDKGIHIAYSIKLNGIIEIESLQFPKRAQWHVLETPSVKQNDWADHLRGACIALNKRYPLRYGLSAIIAGELPISGLSSSAAVIITFVNALAFLNNIKLTEHELMEIGQEAENNYVGIFSGKLDLACEIYAKKNKLLYMNLKDNNYDLIETPSNMKPYVIGLFFSGIEKNNNLDIYNIRTDELRSTAYLLKALSGMSYGKFKDTNLIDVPFNTYLKYKDKLPVNYVKRAEHFYSEIKRVENGVKAYKNGDIEAFGKLITESGSSSITNWETGSKELIDLFKILKSCQGVYGTRFSGSGFKGCCIALINPNYVEKIKSKVENEYLNIYPELKDKYSVYICNTANGINL